MVDEDTIKPAQWLTGAMVTSHLSKYISLRPPFTHPQTFTIAVYLISSFFLYQQAGTLHISFTKAQAALDLYRNQCALIVPRDSTSQMAEVQWKLWTSIQTSRRRLPAAICNATRRRGGDCKAFNAPSRPPHLPRSRANRTHSNRSLTCG